MSPQFRKIADDLLCDAADPKFRRNEILLRLTRLRAEADGPEEERRDVHDRVYALLDGRNAPF